MTNDTQSLTGAVTSTVLGPAGLGTFDVEPGTLNVNAAGGSGSAERDSADVTLGESSGMETGTGSVDPGVGEDLEQASGSNPGRDPGGNVEQNGGSDFTGDNGETLETGGASELESNGRIEADPYRERLQPTAAGRAEADQVLLNFDGWVAAQDDEMRARIGDYLRKVPVPQLPAARRRLASLYAVSEETGMDIFAVRDHWAVLRGGISEQRGWEDAKFDDEKFHAFLKQDAQQRLDERQILHGPEDGKDPKAAEIAATSLDARVMEFAYAGTDYTKALAWWQSEKRGKPGYDERRAGIYAARAKAVHEHMTATLDRVRPVALEALSQMLKGRGVEKGEGDIAPFALFRGMPNQEKRLAFRVMMDAIEQRNAPRGLSMDAKSRTQAFGEAIGRGFENLALGGGSSSWRSRLLGARFKAGDRVGKKDAVSEVSADYITEMSARSSSGTAGGLAGLIRAKDHILNAEEAEQWNQQVANAIEDVDTAEQLRKFSQEHVDSTKVGGEFFQNFVLPVADSTAIMTSMAIPGAWAPVLELSAKSYQNDEYLQLLEINPDADKREAHALAGITGLAQAVLDRAQFGVLKGFGSKLLPKTTRSLRQFSLSGRAASRFLVNTAGTMGAETGLELTQQFVIPALVRDLFAHDPKFDPEWGEVWSNVAQAVPGTAAGMLFLSALGGLGQTRRQSSFVREFSSNPSAMRARGYSLEQIDEIQAAPDAQKGELLAQYLPAKAPTGEARSALVRDVEWLGAQEQAAFDERARAETAATAEALESGIRMTRKGAGWEVREADGTTVTLDSAEAARRIREDLKQAATQREAEALVSIIDRWHDATPEGVSRETVLTGESVRSDGKEITRSRDGAVAREVTSERDLQRLREQARMDARRSGHEEIDVAINGVNWVGRVARGAREVYQRLEIHRSPGAAMTFLHESVEADWRLGIQSGAITLAETQGAIASVARAFDPAKARDAAERAFRERVQRVALGEASDTEMRETFSELAVADVFGRRRDGTTMPAGSISAALDAAMQAATNPAAVRGLGKLRAFLRAVRTNLRALFGTVAALRKARREGGAKEFDALMEKLLGADGLAKAGQSTETAVDGELATDGAAFNLKARTDAPTSWENVKPGHSWSSAKKFLPKLDDARPDFFKRGSWEQLVARIAGWLPAIGGVRDPWGATVRFDNPQSRGKFGDPLKNRAAHLIGENLGDELRELDTTKLDWIGATETTIKDAQVRVVQGEETMYFRSYKQGVHLVVVEKGGVKDQYGLVTQYAPELRKTKFEGALVERIRPNPGLAPQGGPGSVRIPTQPQSQTAQTPNPGAQTETNGGP